ncbi:MAG: hypothetical protein M1839_008799 [Geoglossum umbratile]|nr:MAG: hypothetical protein M1839_008799 [Geoglossum umbratile]
MYVHLRFTSPRDPAWEEAELRPVQTEMLGLAPPTLNYIPKQAALIRLPYLKLSTSNNEAIVFRVTRSHKLNDRDHAGLADGTAAPEEHLPRYFAKSGPVDTDPKKTKKDGAGKGNWGREGDEIEDYNYNMTNPRRRSNSNTVVSKDFKTKFEAVDPEPVFEEELHGPMRGEDEKDDVEKDLSAVSTTSSASVEDEEVAK